MTLCKVCNKKIRDKEPKFGFFNKMEKYPFKCFECKQNENTEGIEFKVEKVYKKSCGVRLKMVI